MKKTILLLFSLVLNASYCSRNEKNESSLSFSRVTQGNHIEIDADPALFVLRSREDLKLISPDLRDQFAGVDWQKSTVVGLARSVNTGGYSLEIQAVESMGDGKYKVQAKLIEPPPDSMTTMVISQPYDFVAIDGLERSAIFHFEVD